jgi:hypothetical protein
MSSDEEKYQTIITMPSDEETTSLESLQWKTSQATKFMQHNHEALAGILDFLPVTWTYDYVRFSTVCLKLIFVTKILVWGCS